MLATGKATLTKKKAKLTIKAKKAIKAGRYTLRITLTQTGRQTATLSKTIRLEVGAPRAAGRPRLPRGLRGRSACARRSPARSRRRDTARCAVTKIAGTNLSAQEVADAGRRGAAQRRPAAGARAA